MSYRNERVFLIDNRVFRCTGWDLFAVESYVLSKGLDSVKVPQSHNTVLFLSCFVFHEHLVGNK